jgi:hypothetical protein
MARVLKPGGFVYIREPAYDWLRGSHDQAVGTRHRFTLGELKRVVGAHGLILRRATYANTILFLPAVAHRLLSRASGGRDSDVKPLSGWLNSGLRAMLEVEARLLRRFNTLFGLSVIVLAQKEYPIDSSNRPTQSSGGRQIRRPPENLAKFSNC